MSRNLTKYLKYIIKESQMPMGAPMGGGMPMDPNMAGGAPMGPPMGGAPMAPQPQMDPMAGGGAPPPGAMGLPQESAAMGVPGGTLPPELMSMLEQQQMPVEEPNHEEAINKALEIADNAMDLATKQTNKLEEITGGASPELKALEEAKAMGRMDM